MDGSGNVYTTGRFGGSVDFDPGAGVFNLTSAGEQDIFVSKLDSAGNFVWARRMGGADLDRGIGVTVDDSGIVYTTGHFQGSADFDPGAGVFSLTSTGLDDIFVSKLDSAGIAAGVPAAIWSVSFMTVRARFTSGSLMPSMTSKPDA